MDLNLKSGHLVFNGFVPIFGKSVAGFVGMWKSCRLFQVVVGTAGPAKWDPCFLQ